MKPETFPVLGVDVSAVTLEGAVDAVEAAIREGRSEHVCVCSVNMVLSSREDDELRRALDAAGLVVPDGFPITKVGRLRARRPVGRVRGADLTRAICRRAAREGHSVYLHGGAEGVPEAMAAALREHAPGLDVAGTRSPPFREQTPDEVEADLRAIDEADPDVVFVGLGCPKQEGWMLRHRDRLDAPVLVGVGAAFDFIAGAKPEAPALVQRAGLEWLWRFGHEPGRLWRRVLVEGPQFLTLLALDLLANGRRPAGRADESPGGGP